MRLPVLPSLGLSQEHGGENCATDDRVWESPFRLVGLHYSRFGHARETQANQFKYMDPTKIRKIRFSTGESAKTG
jgi:hypothetical protein